MAWQTVGPCQPCQPSTAVQQIDPPPCPRAPGLNESFSSGPDGFPEYSSTFTRHRESVSSSSGSSICELPAGRRDSTLSAHSMTSDTNPDPEFSEEPWNLVAYHVPWGPVYEGYESGTLPGPDGICIFLRSPTPLKRQRTSQACEKCRGRKAKCTGARPSCARCLSRGFSCVYGASTTDGQPAPPRASLRRSSHSGSSALKPKSLKVSTVSRIRMRRKGSAPGSSLNTEGGSLQDSIPECQDTSHGAALCEDIPADLDGALSSLSLPGEEYETPDEPLIPSYFDTSPESDASSYKFSGLRRARDPFFSVDTSLSLYMDPLSTLAGYRFPPDDLQKNIAPLQLPPTTSNVPFDSHTPVETPNGSLLITEPHVSSEQGVFWHDTQSFAGCSIYPDESFPGFFMDVLPCDSSEPSQGTNFSQCNFVQRALGDNTTMPAHFPS